MLIMYPTSRAIQRTMASAGSNTSADYELWQMVQIKNEVINELALFVNDTIADLEIRIDTKATECQTLLQIVKSVPYEHATDEGSYGTPPDNPARLIGVVEKLMVLISMDRQTIKDLNALKTRVGTKLENVRGEACLPGGWVQY